MRCTGSKDKRLTHLLVKNTQASTRSARLWRIAMLGYLAVFVYGFLLLHAAEDRNRIINEIWDLGHVGAYFVLIFLVYRISDTFNALSLQWQLLVAMCAAITIGLVVEFIQLYTGRSFSLNDVFLNVVGTVAGITLFTGWRKYQSRKVVWLLRVLVIILFAVISREAVIYSLDAWQARQEFPSLLSLKYPFEMTRLSGPRVKLGVMHFEEQPVAEVLFLPAKFSTLTLDHFPRDWSSYRTLRMELYNDSDDRFGLYVRVHDIKHFPRSLYSDRFNATYLLQPGWNSILISLDSIRNAPRSRSMDMKNIHQLMLFCYKLSVQRRVLIRYIGLE